MKRSQSKWSSSMEERGEVEQDSLGPVTTAEEGSDRLGQGGVSASSPDTVFSRIRKAVTPPKGDGFQEMTPYLAEVELMPAPPPVFFKNATSTQVFPSSKLTSPTQSNRRPSQSQSLANRRVSKSPPKPASPPSIHSSPEPEAKGGSLTTKAPKSPATRTSPPTLASGASFEMTPLSGLIAQSYTDIALLRRLHETQCPTYPSPTYSPASSPKEQHSSAFSLPHKTKTKPKPDAPEPRPGKPSSRGSPQVRQSLIDFDRVEDNLRKFDMLYRQFLNYGGRHGEKADEVHLVAVVCKRSDVVRGKVGDGDESVPRLQRVWVDCGL